MTGLFIVVAALAFLMLAAYRGYSVILCAPIAAMGAVLLTDPSALAPVFSGIFMERMAGFAKLYFPVFLLGAVFGKLIELSGFSRAIVQAVLRLIGGLVRASRGQVLFEEQAFEISAQAGSMVGVEKEERTTTPWPRALMFRHPWLQLNLLTAFVAAAVVGYFQNTVNAIVLLAVFLPVLSGQCSNTGCQALAVTLRGMTLNEIRAGRANALLLKEAWLGLLNGLLVGCVAAIGMFAIAHFQHNAQALPLALITLVAMALSSVASGVAGAAVPMVLKKAGADPAMASSIFLTTATDVVSMGLFLGLAQWLLL